MNRRMSTLARFSVLVLILTWWLAACGGESALDPTPLLPPPPTQSVSTPVTETAVTPNAELTTAAVATAVADGTATPTLAPTPTLLPTSVPDTQPALQPARAGQLPPISHDLVWLSDGALLMWNHNSGQIQTLYSGAGEGVGRESPFTQLPGDITQYDVSADGNRITAVRLTASREISATLRGSDEQVSDEQTVHELLFLDTVSRESWTLAAAVTNLREARIAPNQREVAFIATNLGGAPATEVTRSGPPLSVFLAGTPDGETRRIADCVEFCYALTWHPQSNLLTWTDREALWLYNLESSRPQVLLANRNETLESTRLYAAIDWAANGRFLLLWEQVYEGGSRAVLDVPTQQLMPVPDSFVFAEPFATEVSWMQDDRLLVLRSLISGQTRQATIELWRVAPESGELAREEVSRPDLTAAAAGGVHLADGRFAYGLLSQSEAAVSGLYIQDSLTEPLQRVNGLIPAFIAPDIIWAPDGSGAVVRQDSILFYAPAGGDALYDLRPVTGAWARSFTWLPPGAAPR